MSASRLPWTTLGALQHVSYDPGHGLAQAAVALDGRVPSSLLGSRPAPRCRSVKQLPAPFAAAARGRGRPWRASSRARAAAAKAMRAVSRIR
eukprot:1145028-Pyramimonas_sp.AAC.1